MATNTICSCLVFFVNGKKVLDQNVDPEWTLLYYLRQKLRLCGTKLSCGEGGCGACTVMVSKFDRISNKIFHSPVIACLTPVCSMHGLAVTTVEGIGSTKTKLHPVQERIAKSHGSQCGYCTPGIVMSMYTLLRNSPKPSMRELEIAFQGNQCRCTGYRPIIEGYKTFTEEWELIQNATRINETPNGTTNGCAMGAKCCKMQNATQDKKEDLFKPSEFTPHDSSQEPIFPPELKLSDKYDKEFLIIKGKSVTWYRPTTLEQLLELKKQFPEGRIVVGNTEVGVEVKFKHIVYPVIIQPVLIPELIEITKNKNGVRIGASVTLAQMETFLQKEIATQPQEQTKIFKAIVEMLNWFAGKQIRSVGSVGGNIMTASPISDLIPIFMANEVVLEVQSQCEGLRQVLLDNNFVSSYRQTVLKPNEILLAIHIPYTNSDRYCYAYKQARRREDDIAIVNMALSVTFLPKTDIIADINLAFGGVSFKTVTASTTRKELRGLPWNKQTLEKAFNYLQQDLPLDPGAPGGMILYRKSLTLSLFLKAFLSISADLQKYVTHIKIDKKEMSAIKGFHNREYKSSQYFTIVPETQEKSDSVQRPLVHRTAYQQATGEAVYVDDIPFFENELYIGFVLSTKSYAKILSIDASAALDMEGVLGFLSAKDVDPARNAVGCIIPDEKIFYDDEVTSQGQTIGVIVAENQIIAQKAARKVKVTYKDLRPIVVTIEDAIKHNSYLGSPKIFTQGDVETVFQKAPNVLQGECRTGGQEHFYFETQSAVVVPKKENYELDIYSATQHPSQTSYEIGKLLGISQNKISVKVKRLGGAFGGKEFKSLLVAAPAALAAVKYNRPVRCALDRDEDIAMTGGRNPYLFKYKAAFDNNGAILAVSVKMYSNCGYSSDLSPAVIECALLHVENAYKIPAIYIEGHLCKTNIRSHGAFRGFGRPQGMFAIECIIQDIADHLNKDAVKIREINFFKEGDLTMLNQKLTNYTLDKCWKECIESSDYYKRLNEVAEFNRQNRYKKRGLSVVPTKFGIAFEMRSHNQAGALVHIYIDGSVLVSHGGIEMGQGLHTKMIQVASKSLNIPVDKIYIVESATDKVPNTSPTGASTGSDLNGMAVLKACEILNERLEPFKQQNPKGTWEDWINTAYFSRVSLSATGYYATPDLNCNWEKKEGNRFNYYSYGAACCQVEIDTLNGDHQVQRVDIVMDVGQSLNPAIDIGQIEGAFMQGYGLFVLEEMVYSPDGTNYTTGFGTYKIPGFGNIPEEFNVSILKGSSNPRAIYSSKAIGEPPLFLGSSVLFAIRDAIKAARLENGYSGNSFTLNAPATAEKIRMACKDNITAKFHKPDPDTFTPWSVTNL